MEPLTHTEDVCTYAFWRHRGTELTDPECWHARRIKLLKQAPRTQNLRQFMSWFDSIHGISFAELVPEAEFENQLTSSTWNRWTLRVVRLTAAQAQAAQGWMTVERGLALRQSLVEVQDYDSAMVIRDLIDSMEQTLPDTFDGLGPPAPVAPSTTTSNQLPE